MFTPKDYDVGTAAALKLIQQKVHDIMPMIPFPFRGRVPVDKEPEAAQMIAKCVLDAVAASHPVSVGEPAGVVGDVPLRHA